MPSSMSRQRTKFRPSACARPRTGAGRADSVSAGQSTARPEVQEISDSGVSGPHRPRGLTLMWTVNSRISAATPAPPVGRRAAPRARRRRPKQPPETTTGRPRLATTAGGGQHRCPDGATCLARHRTGTPVRLRLPGPHSDRMHAVPNRARSLRPSSLVLPLFPPYTSCRARWALLAALCG